MKSSFLFFFSGPEQSTLPDFFLGDKKIEFSLSPPLIPNPSKYPRGLVICQQPSHDLVSAFHEEPTDPDRGEREQWKSQVERSDGILEIASLGFVSLASKSRVSALILGTAHRLLLVSEQEQEDQAATNCDQVSPILRTTPFKKPEIWCSTCGRYGSHWKLPKPGESSEL